MISRAQAQRRSRGKRDSGARERLLAAARVCVRQRGTVGTSSRLIAETSGENLAAITYYFGSKQALVTAALADELREWVEPVLAALSEDDTDPATRLLGAVEALTDVFETQRARVPTLLDMFVHAARSTNRGDPLAGIWNDVHTKVARVVTELQERDAIATWVEASAMASLILSVVAGTVVNEAVDPSEDRHRQVASQFAGLLLGARSR